MRVGVRIILSVLSFSVLAIVIPNYDSHVYPLARRAVNPNSRVTLWKRNNGEQTGPGPSSSGAGASTEASTSIYESNPNYSSNNRGRSKLDQLRDFVRRLYRSLMKNLDASKQKYNQWRDKKTIKATIKKLTEVVEDKNGNQFISDINKFLSSALEGARGFIGVFDNKAKKTPFFLTIPKGKKKKSLTKKMTKIQNDGRKVTKENLQDVNNAITRITKFPQDVVRELGEIMSSASRMYRLTTDLHDRDYRALMSNVKDTNNEEHVKSTEKRISEMKEYRDRISSALDYIKEQVNDGRVTFKEGVKGKTKSRFGAFKSGFKKRLGFKKKLSTGVPPNQEPSNQESSNRGQSKQDTSDEEAPDQARTPRFSKPIAVWV
ncbi:hypothetical protein BASA50_003290 [Batrachochytrium salamandrivorans]|uniref:SXP/RAL-2 family protein Ani s 5-like cation-binding domain-containing protein n=1 Tax=Batrachochytrium salamandrivorans TaxID=1357716 RepID=A0ABQ8FJ14_9FUNG|nr:hypothetical protein BASA62_006076 [Batrachochytrium salamandrivorans]KAH6582406.1 hypothetical protein BASA60_001949 [Batrachochytrium salamandrivorans]KAH6599080.1 hypothetical protein BASA50_003290 [Batrachochytrium salamandrivorans]KAH9265973.1 hypothetical protein BASA83_010883 [Batrachochytrium salamandrivorans]